MADDNLETGADPKPAQAAANDEAQRAISDANASPHGRDADRAERAAAEEHAETADRAGERISKFISRAGIASRRDVERMIEEGRIKLNGTTVTTPVVLVTSRDRIEVDGEPLPERDRSRLFLYHKPAGLVTTEKDPEGRPTVFAALPSGLPRLVSIGRLDFNTEGLLLLTNDGGLARVLAHPKTGWLRRYRVRAFGEITQDALDGLQRGIEIDGMHYGPVEAHVDREQGSNMWLTLGLREGKNREVKRILEHFGLKVNRLIRISFGPFRLGELPEGEIEEVRSRLLRDQLGPELAREAKVDFGEDPQVRRDGERRGPPARRGDRERGFERRHAAPQSPADAGEGRTIRKAEAIAQARRGAAHRHSWRDAESWALRGERKPARGRKSETRHPVAGGQRRDRAETAPDERRHLRGGRIADRKGHSVLVERIARDPAAGEPRGQAPAPERRRSREAAPNSRPRKEMRAPRGEYDVLRRKSLREQGIAPRQREDRREGAPRYGRFDRDGETGRRGERRTRGAFGEQRRGAEAGQKGAPGRHGEMRRGGRPASRGGPEDPRPFRRAHESRGEADMSRTKPARFGDARRPERRPPRDERERVPRDEQGGRPPREREHARRRHDEKRRPRRDERERKPRREAPGGFKPRGPASGKPGGRGEWRGGAGPRKGPPRGGGRGAPRRDGPPGKPRR